MKIYFLLVLGLSVNSISAQDFGNSKFTLTGKSIQAASTFTQDARNDFYRVLTYQAINERPLTFFGINFRAAPANFILDSGEKVEDHLNRILLTMGTRLGKHLFVGVIADGIENFNLLKKDSPGYDPHFKTNISQGLVYGGLYLGNLQATVAWTSISPQSGVNIRGELVDDRYGNDQIRTIEAPNQTKMMYSVYVNPGIYVSFSHFKPVKYNMLDDSFIEGNSKSEFQLIVQSPKRFLPDWAGLPFATFERYSKMVESYNKPKTNSEYVLFSTVGSDDMRLIDNVENLSFRVAVQYRVDVLPKFQFVEATGKWTFNEYFEAGLRSFIFNKSNSPTLATDEYISFGWKDKARWAFTHSYNSPDRSTFLPFSGVHVYGFQVVYGISDIIKPLIPMIRSKRFDDY